MSDYYTPCIVRETSEGTTRIPIADELLQRREIHLTGEITAESVNGTILQLRYLQTQDPDKEITIYINSPGGSVSDGLALIDVMGALRCPIRTVCMGMAASMAALIFASGHERQITEHSRIMIHDPRVSGGVGGDALHLYATAKDLMHTREVTAQILAGCTGHSIEEIYEKTETDTYFTAQEALEWGLADKIIHEI